MSAKDIELAAAMMTNIRNLTVHVIEALIAEDRETALDAAGACIAQAVVLQAKVSGKNTVQAAAAFKASWTDVVMSKQIEQSQIPFSLN